MAASLSSSSAPSAGWGLLPSVEVHEDLQGESVSDHQTGHKPTVDCGAAPSHSCRRFQWLSSWWWWWRWRRKSLYKVRPWGLTTDLQTTADHSLQVPRSGQNFHRNKNKNITHTHVYVHTQVYICMYMYLCLHVYIIYKMSWVNGAIHVWNLPKIIKADFIWVSASIWWPRPRLQPDIYM